jgi:hypothetical protein
MNLKSYFCNEVHVMSFSVIAEVSVLYLYTKLTFETNKEHVYTYIV